MFIFHVRGVNDALPICINSLLEIGVSRDSRNGEVLMFPGPATTLFTKPDERVIFAPERDANPFFHLMESLWMLAGRDDVEFVAKYVKRMKTFSDNGETLNGAYGRRWRSHFLYDQLSEIIDRLQQDPTDRRCVLQMWDATDDLLNRKSKDVPCNTNAYFSISARGALDMTVCNRSNDIVWGAYGANVVHFSMLQEYMARSIGVPLGHYWQMSNNLHAYTNTLEQVKPLADQYRRAQDRGFSSACPYELGQVRPFPLMRSSTHRETWDHDLQLFFEDPATVKVRDPFFSQVAKPVYWAWEAYKSGSESNIEDALEILKQCRATDWAKACREWLERRKGKAEL